MLHAKPIEWMAPPEQLLFIAAVNADDANALCRLGEKHGLRLELFPELSVLAYAVHREALRIVARMSQELHPPLTRDELDSIMTSPGYIKRKWRSLDALGASVSPTLLPAFDALLSESASQLPQTVARLERLALAEDLGAVAPAVGQNTDEGNALEGERRRSLRL